MATNRNNLEQAFAMLYKIQMCQAMAMSSENSLNGKFNQVSEYAYLLEEFLPRLEQALNGI